MTYVLFTAVLILHDDGELAFRANSLPSTCSWKGLGSTQLGRLFSSASSTGDLSPQTCPLRLAGDI